MIHMKSDNCQAILVVVNAVAGLILTDYDVAIGNI